jgi:hypothetical protein
MLEAAKSTASTGTPLWVVLLVAFLGVVGTVTAALLTQIYQARQEARRAEREDKRDGVRWDRERQRESLLWGREDEGRFWDHRRTAYIDYLAAHQDLRIAGSSRHVAIAAGVEPAGDWIDMDSVEAASSAQEALLLFGSREARDQAILVWDKMVNYLTVVNDVPHSEADAQQALDTYMQALSTLRATCRKDLRVEAAAEFPERLAPSRENVSDLPKSSES